MPPLAQWGPHEAPAPSEPRAPLGALVFGALSLIVSGLALATAVVSTSGMAIMGEPYTGTDLAAAATYGSLGALVSWIGWRAYRRDDPGARSSAAILGRLAPVLGGTGLLLGVVAGVWVTIVGYDATISIDRGHCARFTGPLEPRDREACRAIARECRKAVRSGPVPEPSRGLAPAQAALPEGLALPSSAEPRAIVRCMLERGDAFLP